MLISWYCLGGPLLYIISLRMNWFNDRNHELTRLVISHFKHSICIDGGAKKISIKSFIEIYNKN
jgi:hypothetical protein